MLSVYEQNDLGKWIVVDRMPITCGNNRIVAAAFNAITSMCVVAGEDGDVTLFEFKEKCKLSTFNIGEFKISTLCINKSGEWISIGTDDGQLVVWEWTSESYIIKQQMHLHNSIECMAYSPHDKKIATGGHDGKVKVWDMTSEFCFVTFEQHKGPISDVTFGSNKDVDLLCSSSIDGTVRAFDLKNYRNFKTFAAPSEIVQFSRIAINQSCDIICVSTIDDFDIYIFDFRTQNLIDVISAHDGPLSSLNFLKNNSRDILISSSWDKTVRMWALFDDKSNMKDSVCILEHSFEISDIAVRPDGKQIAVATIDGQIQFWNLDSHLSEPKQIASIEGRKDIIAGINDSDFTSAYKSNKGQYFKSISYSSDGNFILGGGHSPYFCLYECNKSYILVQKMRFTRNLSFSGTKLFISRKHILENGPLGLIDYEEIDDTLDKTHFTMSGKYLKHKDSLPGVQKGDMSQRTTKPEVMCKQVMFSFMGESFCIVCTDGVICYRISNHNDTFIPFMLDYDATPKFVFQLINDESYAQALECAFKLNVFDYTKYAFFSVPYEFIRSTVKGLSQKFVSSTLNFISELIELPSSATNDNQQESKSVYANMHFEYIQSWITEVINAHSLTIKQDIDCYLPSLRRIKRYLKHNYDNINSMYNNYNLRCTENIYMIKYLNMNATIKSEDNMP